MQYLYAADRDNKRVAERFDPLSAGFLRALKAIAEVGERTARRSRCAARSAGGRWRRWR